MAPCPFPHLGALLLLALAVSARASAATDTPQQPAAASVPGSRFLHACCANTTNASTCYDSLLPSAGSFHGNRVRVATAAAEVAFSRLRTFLGDLRRLQHDEGTAGSGRDAEIALRSCVTSTDACVYGEADALAALRRLETAAGRRSERAGFYRHTAGDYVGSIVICATTCIDGLGERGDAAYATPVGKKMVAWATNVHLYGVIALDLVASIKL